MKHNEASDAPQHTVVLDWDGTLVPAMWPEQPEIWMPGAPPAVTAMHRAGLKLVVHSARMNPYDPWTGQKLDAYKPAREEAYIRAMLDRQGLTFVDIWNRAGKPSGSAYVDDKGYRYTGTKRAWEAMANTLIMHLAKQPAEFPAFPFASATA